MHLLGVPKFQLKQCDQLCVRVFVLAVGSKGIHVDHYTQYTVGAC